MSGMTLISVMIVALIAANRLPNLENFALIRLWVSYATFALAMLMPVAYFWRSPRRLFTSGMIAWAMLTVAYTVAGYFFFEDLFIRLNRPPFMLFVHGALIYGGIAVADWVGSLLATARTQHVAYSSRRRHY